MVEVSDDDFAVRGRSSVDPGLFLLRFQHAHAGVDTRGRRRQTVVRAVAVRDELRVEHCPVRGRSHGLAVELSLLLGVAQL